MVGPSSLGPFGSPVGVKMASQLLGRASMGRYLCIVRRDDPLLLGYVRVALSERMSNDDEFEIIVDRRGEVAASGAAPDRMEHRRRRAAAQGRLNEEGYVILSLDDRAGGLPSAAARRREHRRTCRGGGS